MFAKFFKMPTYSNTYSRWSYFNNDRLFVTVRKILTTNQVTHLERIVVKNMSTEFLAFK